MPDSQEKLSVDIDYLRRDIDDTKDRLDKNYITRAEFDPVRNIAYGLVALICLTILGYLIITMLNGAHIK